MILTLILIALDALLVGMYLVRYLEDHSWTDALIGLLWLACTVLNIVAGQLRYKEAAQIDTSKQLVVRTYVEPQRDSIVDSRDSKTIILESYEPETYEIENK